MGVFVQWSEGRRAQGRKDDDVSCHRHTQNMAYGLAMATTLTTNGMSDFPSVYINHHGNGFSVCVGTLWAIHCV